MWIYCEILWTIIPLGHLQKDNVCSEQSGLSTRTSPQYIFIYGDIAIATCGLVCYMVC